MPLGWVRFKVYAKVVILCQIILKRLSVTSTTFSYFLTCTNPSHGWDAKQQAGAHLLFLLFVPCVFYGHCTT